MPQKYARTHAHLEYENGFLIFDRRNSEKEVWRLASDIDASTLRPNARPDSLQIAASLAAALKYPASMRGHLQPWSRLTMPEVTRAYRFSYPTLAVMSQHNAYLWDIPSGTLSQTIHGIQDLGGGQSTLGSVTYVDVNSDYVFVCGALELRVFSREDSTLFLRLSPNPDLSSTRLQLVTGGFRHQFYEVQRVDARVFSTEDREKRTVFSAGMFYYEFVYTC